MIKRLLRLVGRWARKPVNHTSWVAVVTPTDRPKSVRNRCLIELFCGVVCVVTLPFWHFCWCRGFCHRTASDLFLFLLNVRHNMEKVTSMHHSFEKFSEKQRRVELTSVGNLVAKTVVVSANQFSFSKSVIRGSVITWHKFLGERPRDLPAFPTKNPIY